MKSRFVTATLLLLVVAGSGPAAAQQPEKWASDAVNEAMDQMKHSGHYERAKKEADEAAKTAEERAANDGAVAQGQIIRQFDIQSSPVEPEPQKKKPLAPAAVAGTEYRLFISASMPMPTLREYARQVDELRRKGKAVSMVVRGFVGSMRLLKPTINFYHSWAALDAGPISEDTRYLDVDFQVDPVKAGEYRVSQVPALAGENGCVVYGDVKLSYLLDQIRAKKCGQRFGAVYQFAERNAMDEIQEAAARIPKEKLRAQIKASLENRLDALPGGRSLPKATTADARTIILQASLPFDVPDPKTGRVLYPQGFTFNPLDYARLPLDMILFDGSRPEEVQWAKTQPATVTPLAMGGDYDKLMAAIGRPVFSGAQVADQGWCRATPCRIKGDQNVLRVTEYVVAAAKGR